MIYTKVIALTSFFASFHTFVGGIMLRCFLGPSSWAFQVRKMCSSIGVHMDSSSHLLDRKLQQLKAPTNPTSIAHGVTR